jgi:hypothetical protein
MILTGETRKTRRQTSSSATSPSTNNTWIDLTANPGFRSKELPTNPRELRHGLPNLSVDRSLLNFVNKRARGKVALTDSAVIIIDEDILPANQGA